MKMTSIRPVLQFRNCGTTSKTSNINSSKTSTNEWTKFNSNDSLLETIWKSLSYATTILKPSITANKPKEIPAIENEKESITETSKGDHTVKSNSADDDEKNIASKIQSDNISILEKSSVYLEETFREWIGSGKYDPKKKYVDSHSQVEKTTKLIISKNSLQQRSRFLVRSLKDATSQSSKVLRLEEICKHLLTYPLEKNAMVKDGLLRNVLWMRQKADDILLEHIRVTLSLLGYQNPPGGNGIRILSIDGGGTRGLLAIEVLRQLEARTNRKVYELFDYMCGVSSGAIISFLLGGLRMSPDEVEDLYYKLSLEVFQPSGLVGTSRLMWTHAYYDTTLWLKTLKRVFDEKLVIDTTRDAIAPKIAAISAIMNLPILRPFLFRNYNYPLRAHSQYLGSCSYKMWESIRASGAAPGYFQEFLLDEYLHQDGGILINNPTALAIHECRLLWPDEPIQCAISLGTGRYAPVGKASIPTYSSIKTKVLKMIDSATDTEAVHIALNDLLSSNTYFRFNPYLTEFLSLDENRPEKLQQLKNDTQMYLRRNELKFDQAVLVLNKSRSYKNSMYDYINLQKHLWL